jgi:phosphoesterase RecJ-like protein
LSIDVNEGKNTPDSAVLKNSFTADVPRELIEFIKTGLRFIIAGHKEPDGDCIGSQLALLSVLKRLGKEAVVCSAGPFKRTEINKYSNLFLSSVNDIHKAGARLIIVDCYGIERTGSLEEQLRGMESAVIDHHSVITGWKSAYPVYINAASPSCTLLVLKLIEALDLEITKDEAVFLLFGLCTDSGFFRHLGINSAHVFELTAKLIHAGASPKEIFDMMNGGKSLNSRLFLGHILSRTESFYDGKLLISSESLEGFNAFGYEARDSDMCNQLLQSVAGVEAIVIIRQELADNCTVSFRSNDKIDVARIASQFGGGGHKNAAGLTIKGTIMTIKKEIIKSFKNVFHMD